MNQVSDQPGPALRQLIQNGTRGGKLKFADVVKIFDSNLTATLLAVYCRRVDQGNPDKESNTQSDRRQRQAVSTLLIPVLISAMYRTILHLFNKEKKESRLTCSG